MVPKRLTIVLLFGCSLACGRISIAQQSQPSSPIATAPQASPNTNSSLPLPDRVKVLEQEQQSSIAQLSRVITWFGIAFGFISVVLSVVAIVATLSQFRRTKEQARNDAAIAEIISLQKEGFKEDYGKRSERQAQDSKIVDFNVAGAKAVSEILGVINETLAYRLEEARGQEEKMAKMDQELDEVRGLVLQWREGVNTGIARLEAVATSLASTPRHGFRKRSFLEALKTFAQDYDSFIATNSSVLASARVMYVRGLAAHFGNDFPKVRDSFNKVLDIGKEEGEDESSVSKRLGITYYYLGLNYSNLGQYDDSVKYLGNALDQDPTQSDFLTRLALADAYLMLGAVDKATARLDEVEKGLHARTKGGRVELVAYERGLLCRAALMGANTAVIACDPGWPEAAHKHAEKACEIDRDSYFALLTLGQASNVLLDDPEILEPIFYAAYARIQESRDLDQVQEVRSRILLLMTAAICCKYGGVNDDVTFNRYLDDADTLRQDLPKLGDKFCTVFSPITKLNVQSDEIAQHIERIRKGDIAW